MQRETSEHHSKKELLQTIFKEVFASPGYDEEIIHRYFHPQYMQTVDGKTLDLAQFCHHIQVQKQAARTISIEFKALAEDGDLVLSHHVAKGEMQDGRAVELQILAEFRFRECKIVACNELTHMLSGTQEDRDLGSRY